MAPAWCRPLDSNQTSCLRLMPDGSQAVLYWNQWRHPYSVTRAWGNLSPIAGIDLRDSIRRAVESRGALPFRQMTGPDDTVHHVHHVLLEWCLDSARVTLVRTWQDGYRPENVNMLVSAIPRSGCSS